MASCSHVTVYDEGLNVFCLTNVYDEGMNVFCLTNECQMEYKVCVVSYLVFHNKQFCIILSFIITKLVTVYMKSDPFGHLSHTNFNVLFFC